MMVKLFFLGLLVTCTVATIDGNEGDMMKMIQQLQEEVAELKAKDEILKDEVLKLKTENKAMWDQRQMDAQTMFLATLSEYNNPIEDQDAIIWDTAPLNPGGHFSTILGAYTAPVDGYYQFSATKQGNNYFGKFVFLVDEERYAFKESYSTNSYAYPATSATINIELSAGQIVRVENQGSTVIYGTDDDVGHMNSWFTGYLLYAL